MDEHQDQWEAAREAEGAAEAAIVAARASVSAAEAKVKQAEADVAEADAEVQVARADLNKARVMVQFATVVAPFNGVVTRRTFFPGDYFRAPREGGAGVPLLPWSARTGCESSSRCPTAKCLSSAWAPPPPPSRSTPSAAGPSAERWPLHRLRGPADPTDARGDRS